MSKPTEVILPPINDPGIYHQIDRLARRYVDAGGLMMEALIAVGGSAESLLRRLPKPVRGRMDRIVSRALERAFRAATASRRVVRDRGDLFNRISSTASGALGGLGGLPGAMLELPVAVTLLFRAILDIAEEHGLDPRSDEVRIEALRVFATAGPFAEDDGTDMGLLAAKMSITGQSIQGLIGKIAPKLSAVLSQKLAAQAAPVLGAFAGATINYTFARYYQEIARVHFGLMRLSNETGLPKAVLIEALAQSVARIDASRLPVRRA
ncbi:MAG: EcsC family protein [Paracoccus sp. (in: a-proteobacteria)]|nr:EcsC family protein [Paracoccus sp. (in: a-proteobacteria)]